MRTERSARDGGRRDRERCERGRRVFILRWIDLYNGRLERRADAMNGTHLGLVVRQRTDVLSRALDGHGVVDFLGAPIDGLADCALDSSYEC